MKRQLMIVLMRVTGTVLLLPSPGAAFGQALAVTHITDGDGTFMNSAGDIAGSRYVGRLMYHAFIWSDGVKTDLDPRSELSTFSRATGINTSGQACGIYYTSDPPFGSFLWDSGSTTLLGSLAGLDTRAAAINESAQIVGQSDVAVGISHAFLWADGVMTDLGTLPGDVTSSATAINNSGQIVGWSADSAGRKRPVVWHDDTITELPTLDGAGGAANAINELGVIAGESNGAFVGTHAVLWQDGAIIDLGTFVGTSVSHARRISDDGWVTGEAYDPSSGFVWLWRGGSLERITDLIQGRPGEIGRLNAIGITATQGIGASTSPQETTVEVILLTFDESLSCRMGNVNGTGNPIFTVVTLNDSWGDDLTRHVTVSASTPATLRVGSAECGGHYALWIFDGESTGCVPARTFVGGGPLILGNADRCLPVANLEMAGSCPCPTSDFFGRGSPVGITSKRLGAAAANRLCLSTVPAPRTPVSFTVTFPPGVFTISSVHRDCNAFSGGVSVGNTIVVDSMP